jgi:hypothetical protein
MNHHKSQSYALCTVLEIESPNYLFILDHTIIESQYQNWFNQEIEKAGTGEARSSKWSKISH